MTKNTSPVKIIILDKEYLIACEEEEREALREAADYLNKQIVATKQGGGVIGSERIAVMTALNITHELLAYKKENQDYTVNIDSTLKRLQNKINNALVRNMEMDRVNIDNPTSQGSQG